jgi:hypothetical protein
MPRQAYELGCYWFALHLFLLPIRISYDRSMLHKLGREETALSRLCFFECPRKVWSKRNKFTRKHIVMCMSMTVHGVGLVIGNNQTLLSHNK